jgi:hypothetical protein
VSVVSERPKSLSMAVAPVVKGTNYCVLGEGCVNKSQGNLKKTWTPLRREEKEVEKKCR